MLLSDRCDACLLKPPAVEKEAVLVVENEVVEKDRLQPFAGRFAANTGVKGTLESELELGEASGRGWGGRGHRGVHSIWFGSTR